MPYTGCYRGFTAFSISSAFGAGLKVYVVDACCFKRTLMGLASGLGFRLGKGSADSVSQETLNPKP